ncbi:hydrogenase expression/formation protein [Gluconacetobacter johannae DSM 13595]|uniref:Uncharacterized protein n=1 Tax=Gluconacetobacter johannae TaxID=112140 RepID=A0A7W4P495_9PROT|nr:nickel-dependent hydrogenase large subunit [Gluconacetobacter johannae]MBB2176684.1 hypothetical protein [Gluconacetobacter johannae]GBQ91333.1 hydrogenase expression/formation protein [Gluconacetobacter johannae DSM 13595]
MIGHLTLSGGAGGRPWRMAVQAPVDAGRVCLGLSPADALARVSGLFSLCGAAHGVAAAGAMGLPHDEAAEGAMRGEILRDHAIALLLDWPARLGLPPARALLSRLVARQDDPATLHRDLTGTDAAIGALDAAGLRDWLELGRDATAPVLPRVLAQLRDTPAAWGRAALPPLAAPDIAAALDSRTEAARDAGILADHLDRPALRALVAHEGVSLFARMLARVLDLLACLGASGAELFARSRRLAASCAPGVGIARAARGILAHRAVVRDGRVVAYTVLSPTVWHAAPGGLMERIAATLPVDRRRPVLTGMMLSGVNPCIPVTVAED